MEDLSNTVETYEDVARRYRERHGDRTVVADLVATFLSTLAATDRPSGGDSSAGGVETDGGTVPAGAGRGAPTPDADADVDVSGTRVLDAGCGPGWESATVAAAGADVLGVDLVAPFLRMAREEAPEAEFARMDMRRLGVADGAVDGVWACASFLHVPREDAPATLREFRRVLGPGGVLSLSVKRGAGVAEGSTYEGDARRFTLYRPGELRGMVADAGFSVLDVRPGAPDDGDDPGADADRWIALTARAE